MVECENFVLHEFRNVCKDCRRTREEHPISPDSFAVIRAALDLESCQDTPEYAWIPKRCPQSRLNDFFKQLPDSTVPKKGFEGEHHREKQLIIQFPLQDIDYKICRFLGNEDIEEYDEFTKDRNLNALEEGFVKVLASGLPLECQFCQQVVDAGQLIIESLKAGKDSTWHPGCFVCIECRQMPVDLIHCISGNNVFCLRHFGEYFKNRCHACDELIFGGEQLRAVQHDWHPDHFCCSHCDASLLDKRFFEKDDQPYCVPCYESLFRSNCRKCSEIISVDHAELSFRGEHWHEHCMFCGKCQKQLKNEKVKTHEEQLLCTDCYNEHYAPRCQACKKHLESNDMYIELENGIWHRDCFTCCKCHKLLENMHYIPREPGNFCITCFQNEYSTKCTSCLKPILSSGVTFRQKPYHLTCVICVQCGKSLKGEKKVLIKDEQLYCEPCYAELYCDKCQSCKKAIIGHVRYTKHGDRAWHEECFVCITCNKSVLGEQISIQDETLYCAECAMKN